MQVTDANQPDTIFGTRRNVLVSKWDVIFEKTLKEWIAFRPTLGLYVYPCYSCRHMFSSKKSFQYHINRRAVVLKYNCPHCPNDTLTFYNRCSFLLHARQHFSLEHGEINLHNLEIRSLPFGLAGFLPRPDIPNLFDIEETSMEQNVYINAQFYAPKIDDKGKEVIRFTPSDLIINSKESTGENQALALQQVCRNIPLCQFITDDARKQLKQHAVHVTGHDVIKQEVQEDDDGYDAQNNNNNNNDMTMPVITKVESLQKPIAMKLPKCSECDEIQKECMASHFLGANIPNDDTLKCNVCRFVASTKCSLSAHVRIHDCLPPHICPDCGKNFKDNRDLEDHMENVCFHLSKNVRFRCPGKKCGKLFAMSQTYAQHFTVHIRKMFRCNACEFVTAKNDEADGHLQTHYPEQCAFETSYECTTCSSPSGLLTEENYKEHAEWHSQDRERCMYVYLCRYCKSYFRSTQTYATHLIRCAKQHDNKPKRLRQYDSYINSKYISGECEKCHQKIIYNKDKQIKTCSRCSQSKTVMHEKMVVVEKCYCILCKQQINLDERKSHQKTCKYARPQVIVERLSMERIKNYLNGCSSDSDNSSPNKPEKKRIKTEPLQDELKKKRNRPQKPKKPEIELDLTADEPMEFDGTYHCRSCTFQTMERATFHSHIKTHRDISTAYQCMECAECFVVKPSLVKHLKHYHHVVDCDAYLSANDCYDQEAVKELAEVVKFAPYVANEPAAENQCRVCLLKFEDKEELDKHFRTHGMAFLMKNSS